MLSRNLEQTLHHAILFASQRRHEYATLEHLLLALAEDADATPVLVGCGVDIDKLRRDLINFLDKDLAGLAMDTPGEPKPTAGFQRVVQRAAIHVQSAGLTEITGAQALVSMFSEQESHAVYFLHLHEITRIDAVNFIRYGASEALDKSVKQPTTNYRRSRKSAPSNPVRPAEPPVSSHPISAPPLRSNPDMGKSEARSQLAADADLTTIFISYCHRDRRWVDRLQVHLRPMERDGLIQRWDDRHIAPGQNWREEIHKAIKIAKVAILVIRA